MSPRLVLAAAFFAACSDAPAPATFTPYMPPAATAPATDTIYAQEINHPRELEGRELFAVIDPPAAYTGFERPTAIAKRGWVEGERVHEVNDDLVDAATGGGAIYLASRTKLIEVKADKTTVDRVASGTISAVFPGKDGVYAVLVGGGYGYATPDAAPAWSTGTATITAIVEVADAVYVASEGRVSKHAKTAAGFDPDAIWSIADVGTTRALVASVTIPRAIEVVAVTDEGIRAINAGRFEAVPEFAAGRVPLPDPRDAVRASDGGFIVATAHGAQRIMERGAGPEWRVYGHERWLASEDVRQVLASAEPDSPIYFATAGGLARVTVERTTLEGKLEKFVERIKLRHDRDGAVADSHLTIKGDLSSNIPWDSDNDGSWTSYWLMAECFRWKVTGAADAKANFDKSLDAMLALRDLTGTEWFLARALIRKEGCRLDDCDDPDDGKWYTSPDGKWWVKRDTSNDEVIAHAFMMGHAYDLCADEPQRERIRKHIGGIIGGIVDHGFQLLDPITNLVTTYGQFEPAYVNDSPQGILGDGGQRSAMIISELTLAYYLTGDQKFADAKKLLLEQHHYGDNIVRESEYAFRGGSGDGDEMSTYSFFILLRYEHDPALRARWAEGWGRTYIPLKTQQGAWWEMVHAVVGGTELQLDTTMRWLRLAPVDMVRWNVHNSQRLDLVPPPEPYDQEGRMRSDGLIIPYDERRCDRWNTDQFKVDGGFDGRIEMDGADVLAPYWMGRYYGFIQPR